MQIRKAGGEEMLKLWGYRGLDDAPNTAKLFFRCIASGTADFWALEHDGSLIGELYAFLNIEADPDFADGRTTAYLCAFRVREAYRKQGLGRRLMETVLSDLRSRGFRRATIGAERSDARNIGFYRRMGFAETVKVCFTDPCAMDENNRPEPDAEGFLLLSKDLLSESPACPEKLCEIITR